MQNPDTNPLDDHQDEPVLSKTQQAKKLTVRVGIGVLGSGLIITLIGASQLAGGAAVYGSVGGAIHQAGLVIMFLGTVTLLIGYRIPWLVALMDRHTNPEHPSQTPGDPTAIDAASTLGALASQSGAANTSNAPLGERQEPWLANLVLLAAILGLYFVSALFIMLMPRGISTLVAFIITTVAFMGCLTGLAYGRGYQRTFCLGAIIVMALVFAQWWLVLLIGIPRISSAWPGPSGYPPPLTSQFRDVVSFLGMSGSSIRVYTIIMWAASIALGMFAVGMRFVLDKLNRQFVR